MTYQCNPCVCPEQHYRDDGTFKKAVITLLCNMNDLIADIAIAAGGGTPAPSVNATFAALTPVASAAIGGVYASAVILPADTRQVILDNQTNGNVYVSLDGGATDSYHMTVGGKQTFNLADIGLMTNADVQLKDGITPSTAGTFFVYSIK